jgi:hypothetical protein
MTNTETILIALAILITTAFVLWLLLNLIKHRGIPGFLRNRKARCIKRAAFYGALASTYEEAARQIPPSFAQFHAAELGSGDRSCA